MPGSPMAMESQTQIMIPIELCRSTNQFSGFGALKKPLGGWMVGWMHMWMLKAVKTGLNHLTLLNPISESHI